jgi:hypothetical protein
MQVGDLCKVVKNGHSIPQIDNVIIITRFVGSAYVEGVNTRSGRRHHYLRINLVPLTKKL